MDSSIDIERSANLKVSSEVRAWLARRGFRQVWLSDLLGVGQSAISKRLRGVLPFTAPELMMIANALDVSLAELLGDLVNEKNPHPMDGGSSNNVAGGSLDLPTSRL
ncbi:MAG: helix-turn-helix domain-containing protein [Brevibacterium aurantiacum]|uniref:helix-turn-helix domain-containing protein n=1 Tax=Brevibacterium aurantiacum TaxID=273384 RepID=UPI003F90D244